MYETIRYLYDDMQRGVGVGGMAGVYQASFEYRLTSIVGSCFVVSQPC